MHSLRQMWLHMKPWLPVHVVTFGFLLFGLLNLNVYGVSWDEPLHRGWGQLIAEYVLSGDMRFLEQVKGNGLYYGPLFHMLNYWLSTFAYTSLGVPFIPANHLLTLAAATLALPLTAAVAYALTRSRRVAFFAALLLALYPPFVAHAQYNPKDVPLITAAAAFILCFLRALRGGRMRSWMLAGAVLGLAIALKITAIIFLPIAALALAARLFWEEHVQRTPMRAWLPVHLERIACFGLGAIVGIFVFWPTLWRKPSLLLQSVDIFGGGDFWNGQVLYFAALSAGNALPWHYVIVHMLLSLPISTLVLCLMGASTLVRGSGGQRESRAATVLLLSWLSVPLILSLKPELARYDGIRQFLFVVPAIAVFAGTGLDAILRWLAARRTATWLQTGMPIALLLWLALEIWRVHPYEGSYVNEVVRIAIPSHIERTFEIENWGVTYREGMDWLTAHARVSAVICAPLAGNAIHWYRPWRADFTFACNDSADYIMYFTRFGELPPDYYAYAETHEPVFRVTRYHSDLLYIFDTGY